MLDAQDLLGASAILNWALSGSLHLGKIYPSTMARSITNNMQGWKVDQVDLQASVPVPIYSKIGGDCDL